MKEGLGMEIVGPRFNFRDFRAARGFEYAQGFTLVPQCPNFELFGLL